MPRQIYSGDALYKVELAELIILSRECHLSQDKANTSISATFLTNRTLHDVNRHIPSQAAGTGCHWWDLSGRHVLVPTKASTRLPR